MTASSSRRKRKRGRSPKQNLTPLLATEIRGAFKEARHSLAMAQMFLARGAVTAAIASANRGLYKAGRAVLWTSAIEVDGPRNLAEQLRQRLVQSGHLESFWVTTVKVGRHLEELAKGSEVPAAEASSLVDEAQQFVARMAKLVGQ